MGVALDESAVVGNDGDGIWAANTNDSTALFLDDLRIRDSVVAYNSGRGIVGKDSDTIVDSSVVAHNGGSGFALESDDPGTIQFNWVRSSTVSYNGGFGIETDLAVGSVLVDGSTITHNSGAGIGGDRCWVSVRASSTISHNEGAGVHNCSRGTFTESTVSHNASGGIHADEADLIAIYNSTISDNTTPHDGGGIFARQSTVRMMNSIVANNTAAGTGGGMYLDDTTATIVNSTIDANAAATAGGIYNTGSTVAITNSIAWNSIPAGSAVVDDPPAASTVTYSDVEDWSGPGIGNIDSDPQFIGPGDHRLQPTSPAREAGDNTAPLRDFYDLDHDENNDEPTPDLDGRNRIAGIVDMGPYEMPLVTITPGGFVAEPEGDTGSTIYQLPVTLSQAEDVPVTVDWNTVDAAAIPLIAQAGTDFVSASGTVTFLPGETVQYVDIEIFGDTVDEPPLLYGEWGIVQFTNPQFATLDTSAFFGLGLFIIIDDDP